VGSRKKQPDTAKSNSSSPTFSEGSEFGHKGFTRMLTRAG